MLQVARPGFSLIRLSAQQVVLVAWTKVAQLRVVQVRTAMSSGMVATVALGVASLIAVVAVGVPQVHMVMAQMVQVLPPLAIAVQVVGVPPSWEDMAALEVRSKLVAVQLNGFSRLVAWLALVALAQVLLTVC